MKFCKPSSILALTCLLTIITHVTPGFTAAADHEIKAKIGQMIMVGFRGTSPKNKGVKAVMQQLSEGSIGGVMLMKHNIVSIRQIARLSAALRRAAKQGGQLPPLISVDQEGGYVQRLRFSRFPSAARIAQSSERNASKIYKKLACELRRAGINVNFGPVLDLDIKGRANPIIGRFKRSYGKSPKTVSRFAGQFIAAHKALGVMTVAKHFPGHGSSLKDSHKGFTAIPNWSVKELQPYKRLSKAGTNHGMEMVMVGHLFNKRWGAPASLSKTAITGMLRGDVKFTGLAITDDMEMGAIRKNYRWSTAIHRAVNAGNDILLYSNTAKHNRYLGRKIRDTIAKSICKPGKTTGCITKSNITASYNRLYKAKRKMQISNKSNKCATFATN